MVGVLTESLPPIYLFVAKLFIDFLSDEDAELSHGLVLLGGFIILISLTVLMRHCYYFYAMSFGLTMRKTLTGFLF